MFKLTKLMIMDSVFKQKTKFDWSREYKCKHETIAP